MTPTPAPVAPPVAPPVARPRASAKEPQPKQENVEKTRFRPLSEPDGRAAGACILRALGLGGSDAQEREEEEEEPELECDFDARSLPDTDLGEGDGPCLLSLEDPRERQTNRCLRAEAPEFVPGADFVPSATDNDCQAPNATWQFFAPAGEQQMQQMVPVQVVSFAMADGMQLLGPFALPAGVQAPPGMQFIPVATTGAVVGPVPAGVLLQGMPDQAMAAPIMDAGEAKLCYQGDCIAQVSCGEGAAAAEEFTLNS